MDFRIYNPEKKKITQKNALIKPYSKLITFLFRPWFKKKYCNSKTFL